jgi:hypothetical protein
MTACFLCILLDRFVPCIPACKDVDDQSRIQVQQRDSYHHGHAVWCVELRLSFVREYFWLRSFFHMIVPNIWLRPTNQRREADAAKALLSVPDGDHLTLMNVYNKYMLSTCVLIGKRGRIDCLVHR